MLPKTWQIGWWFTDTGALSRCSNCIRMNKVPRFSSFLISHNPALSSKNLLPYFLLLTFPPIFRINPDTSPVEISSFSFVLLYPVYEKRFPFLYFLLSILVRIDSVFGIFRFKAFALYRIFPLKGVLISAPYLHFSFANFHSISKSHNLSFRGFFIIMCWLQRKTVTSYTKFCLPVDFIAFLQNSRAFSCRKHWSKQ